MVGSSNGGSSRRRSALAILGIAVMLAPLVAWGALSALRSTSNDPRQWLPRSFAETDTYDQFQEVFGTDEIAVLSWEGCTIDEPATEELAEAIGRSTYFDIVRSGSSVIEDLARPPLSLSKAQSIARLRGTFIGGDGRSTCLICTTSGAGQDDRVAAVADLEQLAEQIVGVSPADLKLGGPTVDAAKIDAESRRMLFGLAGLSGIISFAIAAIRLRSLVLAFSVLSVAVYCTGIGLSIVFFSGGKMNLLMTMLPPLIYVLSVSSCVHLVNYYRDAIGTSARPADEAVRVGWFPCSLAALTTGVGLASLGLSTIGPIQEFGWYSAAGVVVSVLMMFLLLPALLVLLPSRNGSVAGGANKRGKSISQRLAASVIRWHAPVTVVCVIIMLAFAFRIPSIESTVRLQDRFLPSSDAIADYRWLEDRIGPMVPLEIVIRFAESDPRDRADQIRIVRSVQAAIQASEPAVATFSAANISPSLPKGRSVREIVKRQMIDGAPFGNALADAGMMRLLDGDTLWRISVRAPAASALDYGELSESIRQAVKPKLESYDVEGVFTGVIPLIYKAQRQLLVDLFRSFVLAFAIIAVVLLFVLRSVPATFAAMIPNLFPAIVIFGGIELIGVPVQIGSVMTASAALGIAVDDTVHFLTWFRRGVREGHSRDDSIRSAFDHCAGAMLLTTLICAGGLSVFALSSFVPILHFAYLMVLLLAAALIGDLVLLPAILAGPLGRLFESKRKKAAGFVASSTTNRVT